MFGGVNRGKEDAAATFQRIIYNALKVKLPIKHIYPVYDYIQEPHHKTHYICYAQVSKMQNYTFKRDILSWFTFKQAEKLTLTQQTKQDIIVAKRVIDAQERERLHTQYHAPHVS